MSCAASSPTAAWPAQQQFSAAQRLRRRKVEVIRAALGTPRRAFVNGLRRRRGLVVPAEPPACYHERPQQAIEAGG
jgi:hypothetical protein